MEFLVLSRNEAKKFSYSERKRNFIVISIHDIEQIPNLFNLKNRRLKGVLELAFDDVEWPSKRAISEADALKIIRFCEAMKDKIDLIVVHCEAGISRSAGVCAALMKIFNNDDMPIFNNARYCPNMSCYRAVLNAKYGKPYSDINESEIRNKHQINEDVWTEKFRKEYL